MMLTDRMRRPPASWTLATALFGVAAAVILTSAAAAGQSATKQRVAINMKILPQSTFVLTPLRSGTLKRDSGTVSGNWRSVPGRNVSRNGQKVTIFSGAVWTLSGKRGTLTIRERNEWVDTGSDVNRDSLDDGVALGTWTVVRGTGDYAGVTGSGGSGHVGLGNVWNARYEGFVTIP
jgi:hypothetical protein